MSPGPTAPTDLATETYGPLVGNRWIQLAAGVVAMVVISNFQYAFTLFTPGLKETFASVPYADIALIYTLFILFETWPVPVAGYFIDKFGIRNLMLIGSVSIFLGWTLGGIRRHVHLSPVHLLRPPRRHRRGHHLHRHGGQCHQMVSRQEGTRGRPDRRGFWGRLGADPDPDQQHHRFHGLGGRHDHVGHRPGHRGHRHGADPAPSPQRLVAEGLGAAEGRRADPAGVHFGADDVAERVLHQCTSCSSWSAPGD